MMGEGQESEDSRGAALCVVPSCSSSCRDGHAVDRRGSRAGPKGRLPPRGLPPSQSGPVCGAKPPGLFGNPGFARRPQRNSFALRRNLYSNIYSHTLFFPDRRFAGLSLASIRL